MDAFRNTLGKGEAPAPHGGFCSACSRAGKGEGVSTVALDKGCFVSCPPPPIPRDSVDGVSMCAGNRACLGFPCRSVGCTNASRGGFGRPRRAPVRVSFIRRRDQPKTAGRGAMWAPPAVSRWNLWRMSAPVLTVVICAATGAAGSSKADAPGEKVRQSRSLSPVGKMSVSSLVPPTR